jgi:molecular chaperone DnaK
VDERTGRPVAIPTTDGKPTLASVVEVVNRAVKAVGEVALNKWLIDEEHVVRWIKRAMGDPDYRFQGLSAVEISAEILKTLKADAERFFGHAVRDAVITCPAYFNANEVQNTKLAGEQAGFVVHEIIKEPTAAAIYYGVDNMQTNEKVMVCDLGGGTFDATILKCEKRLHHLNSFKPLATVGDRQCGGHDWTTDLQNLVAERCLEKYGVDPRIDPAAKQMLYEACELAKRDFARLPQVTIPCKVQDRAEQFTITRDEFEAKTEYNMLKLVMHCEDALSKADLTWENLDRILLVGGSCRLRRLAEAIQQRSGKQPVISPEPDLSVAYGAALIAAGRAVHTRIIPRSLGTRALKFEQGRPSIVNGLIIPHSTEVPETGLSCSRDDFEITADGQKYIDVPMVEFENETDYDLICNYRCACPANAKRGDKVTITFHYDKSGILSAQAVDQKSKQPLPMERQAYAEPSLEELRKVEAGPRWVVFAIDVSGSMGDDNKLENAKQALLKNAKDLLAFYGEACKLGVVSFSSQAEIVCEPTGDLRDLEDKVRQMTPQDTTAMDLGIHKALKLAMRTPVGADREIVMLTDGMPDNDRRQRTLDAAIEVKDKGVTLSIVGVPGQVDTVFLSSLTQHYLVISQTSAAAQGGAMRTLLGLPENGGASPAKQPRATAGITDRALAGGGFGSPTGRGGITDR